MVKVLGKKICSLDFLSFSHQHLLLYLSLEREHPICWPCKGSYSGVLFTLILVIQVEGEDEVRK